MILLYRLLSIQFRDYAYCRLCSKVQVSLVILFGLTIPSNKFLLEGYEVEMKTNCEDVNMGKNKINKNIGFIFTRKLIFSAYTQHANIKSAKRLVSLKDKC